MRNALAWGLAAATLAACGGDDFTTGDTTTTATTTTTTTTTTGTGGDGATGGGGGTTTSSTGGGGAGPACDGSDVCVPPVPASWMGPFVLHVGPDGAPACGAGFMGPLKAHVAPASASPAACNACSCSGPSGGTCDPPEIELYAQPSCSGGAAYSGPVPGNPMTCTDIAPDNMWSGIVTNVPAPVGATCAPSGGDLAMPLSEPTWAGQVALCAPNAPGSACTNDGTCVPQPPAGYDNFCVTKPNDAMCPAGYPNKAVYYHDLADTRACSPCSCGDPNNTSCTFSVQMYTTNIGCQVAQLNASLKEGQCTDATTTWNGTAWSASPTSQGSCNEAGGEPVGEVTATNPQTVCCVEPIPSN